MRLQRLFKFRESGDEAVKPFLDHLEDLRWTLIKMALALAAAMVIAFGFRGTLMRLLQRPLHDIDPALVTNLQVLGILDPLVISLKLAFYAGLVFAFPALLLFAGQFVMPALEPREKKLLLPVVAGGFLLFLSGVSFAYFYVLPQTLSFFLQFSKDMQLVQRPTAVSYFSFVTQMCVALGLAFEMPVVVVALNALGFLSYKTMRRTRIYAIPIVLVFAAVIAPTPDPFTLFAIGLPMCLLYEACIWIAWLLERRRR
jgi:sec-independent protein translocase protein TatC